MHPHASRRPKRFDCCWPFRCGVMAEFVDAPDPVEAEGGELFVEGGAFWRRGRSEELFSAGFSRAPWKRAWGSTSSTNVEEDDSDVDGATSNREWTQTRTLTKIAGAVSVCTEGSREVTSETLASAAIKLFSLCTRNISRTWSDKGGSWGSVLGMSQREKRRIVCWILRHRTHGFSPMFLMPMATSFTIRTASWVSLVYPSNLSSCPSSSDGQGLPQLLYGVHQKSPGIGHKNPGRWAEEHTTKAGCPGGGA